MFWLMSSAPRCTERSSESQVLWATQQRLISGIRQRRPFVVCCPMKRKFLRAPCAGCTLAARWWSTLAATLLMLALLGVDTNPRQVSKNLSHGAMGRSLDAHFTSTSPMRYKRSPISLTRHDHGTFS